MQEVPMSEGRRTEMRRYRTVVCDSARWEGFSFRDDDIVISTPPKCGTTWMQMLCALLIFQDPSLPRPLTEISPWLDMLTNDIDDIARSLDDQEHRRFIKTHTPLDGLPRDADITYISVGRDPRDVALSMDHHIDNIDFDALLRARETAVGLGDLGEVLTHAAETPRSDDLRERFWAWVDNPESPTDQISSLRSTLHHLDTFWQERNNPNIVLFHYEDLQADLGGEMRRLADALGIEVPAARWSELAEAATFDRMKNNAGDLAPDVTNRIWRDTGEFFHRGVSGQWREMLDDQDLRRYRDQVDELADADLAQWAHAGWRDTHPW